MKNQIKILGNLFQKIALWQTGFNKREGLKEHIRMLDWVVTDKPEIREIEEILSDGKYTYTPEAYIKKFAEEQQPEPREDSSGN